MSEQVKRLRRAAIKVGLQRRHDGSQLDADLEELLLLAGEKWVELALDDRCTLIFLDTESSGGRCPRTGRMTEFGAVEFKTLQTFYGNVMDPDPIVLKGVLELFESWLGAFKLPVKMVSDNPAWDYQWINDAFETALGRNPFGHSARRIGDFYAGLTGDFWNSSRAWKRLRVTPHDHNPVNDAMGNVEAFKRMLRGERG